MPVSKYRSIEALDERRRDLWSDVADDRWFQRIARLWERSATLNPRRFPPGVYRYRSVEEAAIERDRWLQAHIDDLRRDRRR